VKSILFFVLILVVSCAQIKMNKKANYFKEFKPIHKDVPVGEVTTLIFSQDFPENYKIKCEKINVLTSIINNKRVGFLKVNYFRKVGSDISCYASFNEKKHLVAHVKVTEKKFPSEKIRVSGKRVFLSKKDLKRVRTEQKFLNSNYFNPAEVALFEKPFDIPLDSHVTSIYGTKRIFNNKKRGQHLGTDYRAPIGTKIRATSGGMIVVARDLFYTGYTVTIDHGLGIFTVYGHLSKLIVKEGDRVRKGDLLALSGNTGRTSGPHLHWGVKIQNDYIDGNSLVRVTKDLFK